MWDQFVQLLKPAADIVTQKLHSMLDTLDKNISSLVNKLDNLVAQAASGLYLDPDQNPKEMLVQLTGLCSEFYVIAEQLNDQSRASEILRGKTYTQDPKHLTSNGFNAMASCQFLIYFFRSPTGSHFCDCSTAEYGSKERTLGADECVVHTNPRVEATNIQEGM